MLMAALSFPKGTHQGRASAGAHWWHLLWPGWVGMLRGEPGPPPPEDWGKEEAALTGAQD